MFKLTVTFENGLTEVFKTYRKTAGTSAICSLSPSILRGDRSFELGKYGRLKCSFEYFNSKVVEEKIDGRKKEFKDLPFFNFRYCYENLI